MKISTILDQVDGGLVALPKFQRGYVWNRDQIRALFDSLYQRHPIGSLLFWTTASEGTQHRGGQQLPAGMVKLLLDGQQRITTIYSVVRGRLPSFFDGKDDKILTGLYFHLEREEFEFHQPLKMKGDPLWVNVSELMQGGTDGVGNSLSKEANESSKCVSRAHYLLGIREIDLNEDEITDRPEHPLDIDEVVGIFNRVNSGGTKLSKGDLALARVCADWPDARDKMQSQIKRWEKLGFNFSLEWLLRSVNAVLKGEAKFTHLKNVHAEEFKDALSRAVKSIDEVLEMIGDRLGLDDRQVLLAPFSIPVMVRYVEQRFQSKASLDGQEWDKLLFWYVQAGMRGRFSGSMETTMDQDFEAIGDASKGLESLLERLRVWRGGSLQVQPEDFDNWSRGARFYSVLYMLTRTGSAKDLCSGLTLKESLLGKMSSLERHHIFPKAQLEKAGYGKAKVHALANFCLLTKKCNLRLADRLPEDYFLECERENPGVLESQWIPQDQNLWKIENYPAFLKTRQKLLAEAANQMIEGLLHGDNRWLQGTPSADADISDEPAVIGGIADEEEQRVLEDLNRWIEEQNLPRGELAYDFFDPETGYRKAVFDLAWPEGIQTGRGGPVAFLLDEEPTLISLASAQGYRCFTDLDEFKRHVETKVLAEETQAS